MSCALLCMPLLSFGVMPTPAPTTDISSHTPLEILPLASLARAETSVDDPSDLPPDLWFLPMERSVLNLGPIKGTLWLKFPLTELQWLHHGNILVQQWANNAGIALFMQEPTADGAMTFVPVPQVQVKGVLGAIGQPLYPSFKIPEFSGSRWFYLRLQADGPTILNLHLVDEAQFGHDRTIYDMSVALYAGVLLGLSVYSLFLMLGVGERSYGWYAAFLLSTGMYVGTRFGALTPVLPDVVRGLVPSQQSLLMVVFVALTAMMFMRQFLGTRANDRLADWVLRLLMVWALAAVPVTLLSNGQLAFQFGSIYALFAMLAILAISLRALLRGYRPAFFLLLGWLTFLFAVMGYVLMLDGLLPYRWYLDMAIPIGSAVEAILLSLGLADRIYHQQRQDAVLRAEQGRLKRLSETDGLTGLLNRRAFDIRLADLITAANRTDEPFVVLVLDADHFKQFNDRFGHLQGDEVLQRLARVMEENARRDDLVFRYGGEEFALLLPQTTAHDGMMIAERIRQRFALEQFHIPGCSCSVSVGLAEWRVGENGFDVVRRADAALYDAKSQGRNRVVAHAAA